MRLAAVALALCCFLVCCGGGGGGGSSSTPEVTPSTPRTDRVLFGYFGDDATSVPETKDHISVDFITCFGATAPELTACVAKRMLQSQFKAIVTIAPLAYQGIVESPTLKADLRAFLMGLQSAKVLDRVIALYPYDEPDIVGISDATANRVNTDIRGVSSEFPELSGVKLAVIYSDHARPGFVTYDWVAWDRYGAGLGALSLYTQLLPGQRKMLLPGGSYGEDPGPWLTAACADPLVVAIIGFLWVDGGPVTGIRSNGMAPLYRAAGQHALAGCP